MPKLMTLEDCDSLTSDQVQNLYRKHVNSARVDLLSVFGFAHDIASHSEGLWIYLKNGKKILDFTGGIGVLSHGHNHPRILKIRQQFQNQKRMEVHKNFYSQYVAGLSANIASLLPGDLSYCFFPNSGSEAVDGALKTAFKYHNGNRQYILHSNISFHGKLFGPASVTNSPENFFPYPKIPNTRMFKYDDIDSLKNIVAELRKDNGESAVAGIVYEPMNVSNMRISSEAFLRELRSICDKENIVLIFDEVYSGWTKTGHLFNFMRVDGLFPDVLCMAKSFGGGKASISGIVTREKIFKKSFDNPSAANLQTSTFYGFGEETVTALEAVNIMIEEDYVSKAKRIGTKTESELRKLAQKYPKMIEGYRGNGALWGLFFKPFANWLAKVTGMIPGDLYKDPHFMNKLVTASVVSHMYSKHDVLAWTSLGEDVHLIIAPSVVAEESHLNQFFTALDKTLERGLTDLVFEFASRKFLGKK